MHRSVKNRPKRNTLKWIRGSIFAALILCALFCVWFFHAETKDTYVLLVERGADGEIAEETFLCLQAKDYREGEPVCGEDANWKTSLCEGTLFLPSGVSLEQVYLYENRTYQGQVSLTGAESAEKYLLEEAAQMPSLWVNLPRDLEYLQEDREHALAGELEVRDEQGKLVYQGKVRRMKGHGNSTWYEAKKSFGLTLSESGALLGMGRAKKWLLISNAKDVTQLRNKLLYDMAKDCGLPHAVESEYTDLYVNGEYQGLYLLVQKIEISNDFLNIGNLEKENEALVPETKEMDESLQVGEPLLANDTKDLGYGIRQGWKLPANPRDISGGYLMEFEYPTRFAQEPSKLQTRQGQCVVVKSPKYASAEQMDYLTEVVQRAEDTLYAAAASGDGVDTLWTYLDLDSFASHYVLDEISKNVDAGYSSTYFYKVRGDEKLYSGPVWDYDLALGNSGGWGEEDLKDPSGYYVNRHGWNKELYALPDFQAAAKTLYQKKYGPWLDALLTEDLAAYEEKVLPAAERDRKRWPALNVDRDLTQETKSLRTFLSGRKAFLDGEWR